MKFLIVVSVLIPFVLFAKPQKKIEEVQSHSTQVDSISFKSDSLVKKLQNHVLKTQREIQKQRLLLDSMRNDLKTFESELKDNNWIEELELLIAFVGGVLLTLLSLILTNINSVRNWIFREFRVEIFQHRINTEGDQIRLLEFYLEMNYKNSEDIVVNYAYFKISKKISINSRENATLGDRILGEPGRFYFGFPAMTFKSHHRVMFTVTEREFLKLLDGKRRKRFVVVVNTSKYGNVKSNILLFTAGRNSFIQVIGDSILDWFQNRRKS